MTDLLTLAQAAKELGLTRSGVKYRILVGGIQARQIGDGRTAAYVITRAELDRVKALDDDPAAD
jgi:hypothetical protein